VKTNACETCAWGGLVITLFCGLSARAEARENLAVSLTTINGDANGDGTRDIADALHLLGHLFLGRAAPAPLFCGGEIAVWRNGDMNADWEVDLSDGLFLLDFLFTGGPAPVEGCDLDRALLSPSPSEPSGGDRLNPGIFPVQSKPYGKSWGEWTAEWWKWAFSLPVSAHPLFDTADCSAGQSGPVWFLGGSFAGVAVTRTCRVPAGKSILLPVVNAECSTVEPPPFHGDDESELRACAIAFMDGASGTLVATVDGQDVEDLSGYRVQSPLFTFSAPADNVLFIDGPVSGQSVSDGYWLFLAPLSAGTHTLHFEGNPGFSIDVTYLLTVGG